MILAVVNNKFNYELEKLCRMFLPFEKIEVSKTATGSDREIVALREKGKESTELSVCLNIDGQSVKREFEISNGDTNYEKECERLLAVGLLECFESITGYRPEWGILTGIRPAKLFISYRDRFGLERAIEIFKEKFLVSERKIELCIDTAETEEKIIGLSKEKSFSLYIGIPFCPSRCSYCSFVSHSVEQSQKLIPQYVEKLCEEIRIIAEDCNQKGLNLETVYIGGGTPTTLEPEQISNIMNTISSSFDLSEMREYTVEAGRPDTITKEKLEAIKRGGATRISINPQTMNDEILEKIGRNHTSEQTERAVELARKTGFDNINMDLIAGLPGEDFESFKRTIEKIGEIDPESVTIHALSMKRASRLNVRGEFPEIEAASTASEMVDYGRSFLKDKGFQPYYMYRQSKTVGNLENVGYAKRGFEGLYNVYIMDETHTIIACGASAVTKLKEPKSNNLERIFNFKYPYEYLNRFDEQILRKKAVKEFYDKLGIGNK